jgi:hypothetical protein
MPPQPLPELEYADLVNLISTADLLIAQKIFYGQAGDNRLSFDQFYELFDILKVRIP